MAARLAGNQYESAIYKHKFINIRTNKCYVTLKFYLICLNIKVQ